MTDAITKSEDVVYCLGIGHGERGSFGHRFFGTADTVDIKTLRAIAEPSGGRAELLENAHQGKIDLVDRAVVSMTTELSQQYTLGYYPTNVAKDGTYRRLTVTTTNPRLTVRARNGYRAPLKARTTQPADPR